MYYTLFAVTMGGAAYGSYQLVFVRIPSHCDSPRRWLMWCSGAGKAGGSLDGRVPYRNIASAYLTMPLSMTLRLERNQSHHIHSLHVLAEAAILAQLDVRRDHWRRLINIVKQHIATCRLEFYLQVP